MMEFPTHEDLARMAEAGRARRLAAMQGADGRFCPLDLGDWMDLCQRADIPTVPALRIATGPTANIWQFDVDTGDAAVTDFWRSLEAARGLYGGIGWMMRWSCGSMARIKMELSEGNADWQPAFTEIYVDDLRAFDLIGDFPKSEISVFARPWITFDRHEGWPVEYRAFVQDSRVIGISNYYPQRPLPDAPWTKRDVDMVEAMTMQLVEEQDMPLHLPQVASKMDLGKNQFTADFARLPSGAILFLEGGPPHTPTWGAHMCCFKPNEIEGVALADRNGDGK